ncbi:hypothetical protein ANTQUA_LOCUS9050 [Anthophora quadrimaculata]
MMDWLLNNGIPCCGEMRKLELMELINENKPQKAYKVDQMTQQHGYTVLRLPPYICELNPIKLIWVEVKRNIKEQNTSILTYAELDSFTRDAIEDISPAFWEKCCQHAEKVEKQYWQQDSILESMMDDFLLEEDDSEMHATEDDSEGSYFSEN